MPCRNLRSGFAAWLFLVLWWNMFNDIHLIYRSTRTVAFMGSTAAVSLQLIATAVALDLVPYFQSADVNGALHGYVCRHLI